MSALIISVVLGIVVLYLGFLKNKSILSPVAVTGLLIILWFSAGEWNSSTAYFHDMVIFDNFSVAFNISMIIITILIFLFGMDYYRTMEHHVSEHYALMIFALTGAFLMTSFSNFIMLFLGIEILSIPLYVLAGGKKYSYRSNEASFKYFMLGSFATTIFLFGIALIYGVTASFYLPEVEKYVSGCNGDIHPMLMIGVLFVLIGVAFKIAAAPFHFWSPDVYEGAPTLVTVFMSTVAKTAGFAAFYRLLGMGLLPLPVPLEKALWVMTGLTLLVGNLGALRQTGFKRLLAYSSIAHSGFIMLAILSQHDSSASVLLYYTFVYSLAIIPVFIIFILVKRAANGLEQLSAFNGLYKEKPWIAFAFVLLMASLAGIPPTSGFLAKFQVFVLSIGQGFIAISLFAIVMAIIGVYYYFSVIREAYSGSGFSRPLEISRINAALIVVCTAGVILLGIFYRAITI